MEKRKLWAAVILVVIGILFVGTSFLPKSRQQHATYTAWTHSQSSTGGEAEGTLINTERKAVTEGGRRSRHVVMVYCAIYEFTASEEKHTATAIGDDCKQEQSEAQQQKTATIVYNADDPSEAFVKSDATAKFYNSIRDARWVSWGLGAILMIAGAAVLYVLRKKATKQPSDEQ
ncbi:MAG: DUF3592 domain-containing protein [Candidatus Saccharimonadales bacterium]